MVVEYREPWAKLIAPIEHCQEGQCRDNFTITVPLKTLFLKNGFSKRSEQIPLQISEGQSHRPSMRS